MYTKCEQFWWVSLNVIICTSNPFISTITATTSAFSVKLLLLKWARAHDATFYSHFLLFSKLHAFFLLQTRAKHTSSPIKLTIQGKGTQLLPGFVYHVLFMVNQHYGSSPIIHTHTHVATPYGWLSRDLLKIQNTCSSLQVILPMMFMQWIILYWSPNIIPGILYSSYNLKAL